MQSHRGGLREIWFGSQFNCHLNLRDQNPQIKVRGNTDIFQYCVYVIC